MKKKGLLKKGDLKMFAELITSGIPSLGAGGLPCLCTHGIYPINGRCCNGYAPVFAPCTAGYFPSAALSVLPEIL